jgi:hypothetical protein
MKRIRILLLLLFISMVSGPWTRAQSKPEIISFDAPGAGAGAFQGTYAYAINPAGVITGWYLDDNNQGWGFLRAPDGAISSFSVQNAGTGPFLGTGAWSINQAGETAGFYADVNCVAHGFVRISGGQTKEFDAPGTGTATTACIQFNPFDMQGTAALDINAAGETAGVTIDANNVEHGFVRTPSGTITVFDAPGAGTASFQGTFPTEVSGLNSSGTIAGTYFDSDSVLGPRPKIEFFED